MLTLILDSLININQPKKAYSHTQLDFRLDFDIRESN